MGQIGNSMIKHLDIATLANKLCVCYALEKELAWYYEVVDSRLFGTAEALYRDGIATLKQQADDNASKLVARITVLGQDLPFDRKVLSDLNPVSIPAIDPCKVIDKQTVSDVLQVYREALKLYYALLLEVKDKDVLTHHTLLSIIEFYVEFEDELENILEQIPA